MKTEKIKKRERSESPKAKKPKRRYRNDRSKRKHVSPGESDESSRDDESSNLSNDDTSSDEKRKHSKKSKRSKKKKKRSRSTSAEERSPSVTVEKHKKSKKKTSSRRKSSESSDDEVDELRTKRKHSASPKTKKKKRDDSESLSPSPVRKKSPSRKKKRASKSPHRRKHRSHSRSRSVERKSKSPKRSKKRSRSPSKKKKHRKQSESKSPEPTSSKIQAKQQSRSRSPSTNRRRTNRRRRKDSDSSSRERLSTSKSPSRRRKKSRSRSKSPRKYRTKSPLRRSRSKSPKRRRHSPKRSLSRRKSRSPSPYRRRKSTSRSPIRGRNNSSVSPSRRRRSRSRSPSRRKRNNSRSPIRKRNARSRSNSRHCSRSKSPIRKNKVSKSPKRIKKDSSKSPVRKIRSSSKSPAKQEKKSSKSPQRKQNTKHKSETPDIKKTTDSSANKNDSVEKTSLKSPKADTQTQPTLSTDNNDTHKSSSPTAEISNNQIETNDESIEQKISTLKTEKISNIENEAELSSKAKSSIENASEITVKTEQNVTKSESTNPISNSSQLTDQLKTDKEIEEKKAIKSEEKSYVKSFEVIKKVGNKVEVKKENKTTQNVDSKNETTSTEIQAKPKKNEKVSVKIVRVVKTKVNPKPVQVQSISATISKNGNVESHNRSDKQKHHSTSLKFKDSKKKDDSRNSKKQKSPEKKKTVDLDDEMKKRRERIEQWRKERKKLTQTSSEKAGRSDEVWDLENDDEDEEEESAQQVTKKTSVKKDSLKKEIVPATVKEEDDEDIDPLDAYMKSISKEIGVTPSAGEKKTPKDGGKVKTVTVVKTVVKKAESDVKIKPEVMEQNQDALEYSSEEEVQADVTASDFADATKRKKELAVADHTKIYYASFRRNFYVEVPELSRMSADEVKLYREELGDIQVRGKNIPKPIKSWAQAGLSSKVMNVLKKCNYNKPTPIQAQAIPTVMSGRDMIGIAKTGSGKTLAFVLPMLRHVLDQPHLEESDGAIAIIMTPTRELALQIYRECRKFCKPLQLSAACIYGGSGISEQIAELKKGAEIIVCTPGRMIDMLAANNGKVTNCRRCTYLVLDEADRMFDMGFEPQVMRILDNIRPDRQTVLFSATFPRQMEAVARKVLQKPIEVQVGGRSIVCSDIEQHALVIDSDNKFFKLLELLGVYHENGSVLVFVEKQETADVVFKDLLKKGYPCLSLHGGMDQFDRDSTISDFKNGVMTIMVSTSVAARGLDVKNLILVVNYDCPNHYEDYVHRVGRTGRAGNKGTAFTFLTYEQGRNAGDIVKAFDLSKREAPSDVLALWNGYKEQMAKEGKKVKVNSGFAGKGFKFNADEQAQVSDAKKMQKFALGLQDSDDEAEAAESAIDKIEADLEKAFSNKPKVALAPEVKEAHETQVKAMGVSIDKGKLKQVTDIAALLNRKISTGQIVDRNTTATANIMQGVQLESLKGVGLAKHLADKVNAKLNYKAIEPEKEKEEEKTSNVRYEEEIDLNDFPQQARWRITSKEIIEQVREVSEAGITVRGIYIPPNKKPEEGEKRLHLYIESLSERSIQIAKAEIKRLLKEELIRAESHSYRSNHQTGRYKVV